jgi:Bacterial archaeo-eukaryotic release factor family 2
VEAADVLPGSEGPPRDLAEVVAEDGPFLSVVLTTDAAVENAAQHSELRWKSLRSELADTGVPEEVLAHVDDLVPDAHHEGRILAVVASASGPIHVEHGDDPEDPDDHASGWWDPLPRLLPILRLRQSTLPHVVVLIDRDGADLYAFGVEGPDVHREVDPDVDPMARSKPGGWSQRRFQNRAENTWEQGAGDVATELMALVERVDPAVVVVAGDVRAVQFLRDALPSDVNDRIRVVDGERPRGGGAGGVPDDVADVIREERDRQLDAIVAKFDEELGQDDLAVAGVEDTIAALSRAQVDVLLVRDDDDDSRAWIGGDPTAIALAREDVEALGVDEPREVRLLDALVRAALGTSASVRVLRDGRGPRDGVGGLLRWPNPS